MSLNKSFIFVENLYPYEEESAFRSNVIHSLMDECTRKGFSLSKEN